MRPLPTAQRVAVGLWLVMTIVVWNGIYDLLLGRGIKEYLYRNALHDAGRGPRVPIAAVMDVTVYDAVWISSLWASAVLLAGMFTIRLLTRARS